jgi:type IV pilus assembly protein PilA
MNTPPPIPPEPSRGDAFVDAFAQREQAPPPSGPPPKQGMSGCAIAAIIAAVVGVLGIFVIGILAAIAIPAYQDYVARARVQQAYVQAQSLQTQVDDRHEADGVCPDNAAFGLEDPARIALVGDGGRQAAALLRVGEFEGGHCGIELVFEGVGPQVDGKTWLFESTPDGWTCDGGTLPPKYRSPQCRGDATTP